MIYLFWSFDVFGLCLKDLLAFAWIIVALLCYVVVCLLVWAIRLVDSSIFCDGVVYLSLFVCILFGVVASLDLCDFVC